MSSKSADLNERDSDSSAEDSPGFPRIPVPTLERLTTYLRCLIDLGAAGTETISSGQIEVHTGIGAAQFRKDLSYFGEIGRAHV